MNDDDRRKAVVLLLTGAAHGQARPKQACDAAFSGTQTARKAGRLAEARELANKCIEGCPAFARSECVRWLREVDDARAVAEPLAQVISRADAALYRAKHGGRNRAVAAGPISVVPEEPQVGAAPMLATA